ncbi:E3 ubiquitin-protein ligase ORTHRUS 2-like [Papaver somniferum]|uniref:E3 ubiquitin-protein ligase ORTHRUS 2-like n=1 Tax=Papaver somniferum TaxID=3469 RepID=UPI000E6F9ECF|nr:E3 ubiquitin-protein ligase ORTHRUS 2-like [Papaver somniferum]
MAQLPCDGDGVCMRCKTKPISEIETLVCITCATPWHVSCLTTPPESLSSTLAWECPDCSSDGGDDLTMTMIPSVDASSSSNELVTMIRQIESDITLTDQEKAKKRQQILSGSLKSSDLDDDDEEMEKKSGNDMMKILDDKLDCPICQSLPDRPVTTPCGHNFCLKCFEKWVKTLKTTQPAGQPMCPKCRSMVPKSMLTNPRINSALAVAIRMAKVARNSGSVEGPLKVYHVVQNQNRPDEAFTTERAKKTGKANAASGKIFVTIPADHFGPILAKNDPRRNQGVLVGESWGDRLECRQWGVHFPHVAGIAGQSNYGAQSVALSGGYQDDEDHGEWFLYTGSGGRDLSGNKRTNKDQSFDQKFVKYNEALRVSCRKGYPVRVVRSFKEKRSSYAPQTGVRYDGVYRIEKCWRKIGIQRHKVCRYLFVRCDNEPAPWTSDEHGDRPRPLPVIKELSRATDVTDRKDSPSWDYDEEESCWKWKKPPPASKKPVHTGNPEDIEAYNKERKAWKKAQNKSLTEQYLKGFKCQLCLEVMTLPLTTPCAHNFCKPCLENVFAGKTFVRERSSHGRTLRAQKKIMKCPSCPTDLSEFLQNPQVNRELMGVIEDLQRKAKEEENDEDPSEELYEPENMIEDAEEGSDNSDLREGNPETGDEPKQMNKRLKTEASYLSRNADGSEFKDGESAVEEMKFDVTDENNVVENSAAEETIAAETKLKKVPAKRASKKKAEGKPKQMNRRLKTEASDLSRNVNGPEIKSGESAAEETIAAETKLKKVPKKRVGKKKTEETPVVVDEGNDSTSSSLQIGSDDHIE